MKTTRELKLEVIDESQPPHDQRQRVALSVPDLATHFGARGQALTSRRYGALERFAQLPASGYTDSSTGTAAKTIAAGVGMAWHTFPFEFITSTSAIDVATNIVLGFKFKIIKWSWIDGGTLLVGSSGSRVANMEIGTTDVGTSPSTCTVVQAGTAQGRKIDGTTVTGANTGSATDTFSIEFASGGTDITAGNGAFHVLIQNMDTADAFASVLTEVGRANGMTVVVNASDAAAITRSTGGGILVSTTATTPGAGDQAGLNDSGVADNDFRIKIGSVSQPWFSTRVRLTSVAACLFGAGFNENASADPDPSASAGDGAMFVVDPTNAASSGLAVGVYGANWLCHEKVNGTDVWTDSGVPFAAGVDVDLEIRINDDLKPEFYIDGVKVLTGTALTSGDVLKVMAAIETTTTAQKSFDIRFLEASRSFGV